jgi:probable rRNA maturation factor
MLEVEVFGERLVSGGPTIEEVRSLCRRAAKSAGMADGHVAIEYVDAQRIAELNARHRGKPEPTDVLSFPIDGPPAWEGARRQGTQNAHDVHDGVPRELGDVVICPQHTADLREAIVHGVLHLVGMDHETDDGEMLALQAELLDGDRCGHGRGDGDRR